MPTTQDPEAQLRSVRGLAFSGWPAKHPVTRTLCPFQCPGNDLKEFRDLTVCLMTAASERVGTVLLSGSRRIGVLTTQLEEVRGREERGVSGIIIVCGWQD